MTGNCPLAMVHGYKLCQTHSQLDRAAPCRAAEDCIQTTGHFWATEMSLDFLAGCLGGCAGVIVGHPLDTIKVHLQTQDVRNPKYTSIWHCMSSIVREDKISGLYRGITSPMAGIGLVNAIVFGVYGIVQRSTDDPNSLYSHFLAGSTAGLLQSVVCAPMELAKTRLQLQHHTSNAPKHKGPLDCMRHIYRTEGMRGSFKGLGITAIRDVPGFASYFVSYEYMMSLPRQPNAFHTLVAGGFAGIFSWLACYPMDVIKTCLQADGMSAAPQYTGIVDCMRKGYAADGYRFFCRGLASTLLRAFPMNAACFFVVSLIMKMTQDPKVDMVVHTGETLSMLKIMQTPNYHEHNEQQRQLEARLGLVLQHDGLVKESANDSVQLAELARRRYLLTRNLTALGAFHDVSFCHADAEELAREFYPDESAAAAGSSNCDDNNNSNCYYLYEDKRLVDVGEGGKAHDV